MGRTSCWRGGCSEPSESSGGFWVSVLGSRSRSVASKIASIPRPLLLLLDSDTGAHLLCKVSVILCPPALGIEREDGLTVLGCLGKAGVRPYAAFKHLLFEGFLYPLGHPSGEPGPPVNHREQRSQEIHVGAQPLLHFADGIHELLNSVQGEDLRLY